MLEHEREHHHTYTTALKDDPIVTNEKGGSQSHVAERFDLIPAGALMAVGQILAMGAERYGENNWHRIPIADHVNHALKHLYQYMNGEREEDHLGHAICRAMFAMHLDMERNKKLARKQETRRLRMQRKADSNE